MTSCCSSSAKPSCGCGCACSAAADPAPSFLRRLFPRRKEKGTSLESFLKIHKNKICEIVVEKGNIGLTATNLPVRLDRAGVPGTQLRVRITGADGQTLTGRVA